MKFLWTNNVANLIGGTLSATVSMIQSLPDAKHTIFSFGRFGPTEYENIPSCVSLVSGSNLREYLGQNDFDVIVFQNTGFEAMPFTYRNNPLKIYYQHSNHRSAVQARAKCDVTFVVSEYLAGLCGLSKEDVLYQPVTLPPEIKDEEYDKWAEQFDCVIGRICSPNPSKWRKEDVVDVVRHIHTHSSDSLGWHFIGCPDWIRKEFSEWECVYFSDTSFQARGFLHKWDYLLYKSSLPETYGRVVKEAQRCGCVPIVSNLGGFKEQIKYGVTGYLCDNLEDYLFAVMDGTEINRLDMKNRADKTGSCASFRQEFLKRIKDKLESR